MVVHNVHDRVDSFIGSWEVEPFDYDALSVADEERRVIYRDMRGRAELGRLSSWRDGRVWVRFGQGDTAAACDKGQLFFAVRFASNHPDAPRGYP